MKNSRLLNPSELGLYEIGNLSNYLPFKKSMTSSRDGIEDEAPERETAMEDAAAAVFNASSGDFSFIIEPRKKPVNVSPAAVVSTAFTLYIGW